MGLNFVCSPIIQVVVGQRRMFASLILALWMTRLKSGVV